MFLEFYLFYVFEERVIGLGARGGYETFHLLWGGVLNIFRRFSGVCQILW
jgi:hypothetical protein